MLIEYEGIKYHLWWKYRRYDSYHDHDKNGKIIAIPQSEYTECHIESLENGIQIISIAKKAPQDQFCKEIGRKLALARVLKKAFPTDNVARALFWANYLNRKDIAQAPLNDEYMASNGSPKYK